MSNRLSHTSAGFTLLEILLVLVLMGLAVTMVMPRLATGSGAQDLRIASERVLTLSRAAQQMAMTQGNSLGLRISQDEKNKTVSYEFLRLSKGDWVSVERNRILREVTLSDDLIMKLVPGASFWQEALDYEESSDTLLENLVTEARVNPDIYFWSSGELSPARLQLCIVKTIQCREVVFEETGEVSERELQEG